MTAQQPIIVIKVGGRFFDELLNQSSNKHTLLHDLKALQQKGRKVVLVHGGGDQVQNQLRALNMHSEKIDGLRLTPFSHMPVVSGVLAGYLNKTLVAHASAIGLKSVGITLADGNISECTQLNEALGAVGIPTAGDASLITALLQHDMLPIIASIGADDDGNLYNVNADHAATCIAQLLHGQLMLLSDVQGVLDANKVKLESLDAQHAQALMNSQIITDGMAVKVKAAQDAANSLGEAVTIGSWNDLSAFVSRLDSKGTAADISFGTRISPSKNLHN